MKSKFGFFTRFAVMVLVFVSGGATAHAQWHESDIINVDRFSVEPSVVSPGGNAVIRWKISPVNQSDQKTCRIGVYIPGFGPLSGGSQAIDCNSEGSINLNDIKADAQKQDTDFKVNIQYDAIVYVKAIQGFGEDKNETTLNVNHCGPSNGGSFPSAPTSGLCSWDGYASDVQSDSAGHAWTCKPLYGSVDQCSAVKAGASEVSATPSLSSSDSTSVGTLDSFGIFVGRILNQLLSEN